MKNWFIIITYSPDYNQIESLVKALSGQKVVIIDNSPGPKNVLRGLRKYTGVNLIRINKENLGYGGTANVGIRYALGRGVEWVVVMNDDLILDSKLATKFINIIKEIPPCIAGPSVGGLDKCRWTTIYPSKKVDYINGAFFAIHRQVVDKIGFFYAPFFLYYEEVDYCLRAKRAGFPLVHTPLIGIAHKGSATVGQRSFLHQYYLARNHLLFLERQAPWSVKLYELVRLPKTIWEHYRKKE